MKRIVSVLLMAAMLTGLCWAKKKTSDKVYDVALDNVRTLEDVKALLKRSNLDEMTVRLQGMKILSIEELTNPYDNSKGKFAIICRPENEGVTVNIEVTKFLFSNPMFEKNLSPEKLYDITFTCAVEEPVSKAKSKLSKAASTVTFGRVNSKESVEYQTLIAKDVCESGGNASESVGAETVATDVGSEKQKKADEKQRKADEEKQRKAEEKQRLAEEKQRKADEEKQRKEDEKRRNEEEKQRLAEEKRKKREHIYDPSTIVYKQMSCTEYWRMIMPHTSVTISEYFSGPCGYKITDVYLNEITSMKTSNGSDQFVLHFNGSGDSTDSYASSADITDYLNETLEVDSLWVDRLYAIKENKKYNGHYTVWVYGKKEGKNIKVTVYNIEGMPSQSQLDAEKAAEETERIAKEEEKAEKQRRINEKISTLTKGYVYHGAEQKDKNIKLFLNGGLESGHAYYISGFVIKYDACLAQIEYGDGFLISSRSSPVLVDYISQQVKAEIIDAGVQSFYGQQIEIPLSVVIAGGKAPMYTPVVLGLIE